MICNRLTFIVVAAHISSTVLSHPIGDEIIYGSQSEDVQTLPNRPVSLFVKDEPPSFLAQSRDSRFLQQQEEDASNLSILNQKQENNEIADLKFNTPVVKQALPTAYINNYLAGFIRSDKLPQFQLQSDLPQNSNIFSSDSPNSENFKEEGKNLDFGVSHDQNLNNFFPAKQQSPFHQNSLPTSPQNNDAIQAKENKKEEPTSFHQNLPFISNIVNTQQNARPINGVPQEYFSNPTQVSNVNLNQISSVGPNKVAYSFTYDPNVEPSNIQTTFSNNQLFNQHVFNENQENVAEQHFGSSIFSDSKSSVQNKRESRVDQANEFNTLPPFQSTQVSEPTLEQNALFPPPNLPVPGKGGLVLRLEPTFVLNNVTSYNDIPAKAFISPTFRRDNIVFPSSANSNFATNSPTFEQKDTDTPNIAPSSITNTNIATANIATSNFASENLATPLTGTFQANEVPSGKDKRNSNPSPAPLSADEKKVSFTPFRQEHDTSNSILNEASPQDKGFTPSHFGRSLVQEETQAVPRGRSLRGNRGQGSFAPGVLEGGFIPSNFFGSLYQNV